MISGPATATEIAAAVRGGQTTALAVTEAALERAEISHRRLNAFTTLTRERALTEARAVDAAIAQGRDPGPLAGVPFAVKNLFDLAGVVTVAGSRISREEPPASEDAALVKRLSQAGAVCLGAVNMGEYAYDFTTENTHYGATRNPWDPSRSAGGSSGGSAAAVAAGIAALALGSDTNGSIRVPSSFCGVWGLKPTYGRLPRTGAFLFVESLDHLGPFARSVADLATAYNVLQGADARDPACCPRETETISLDSDSSEPLRAALLGGYFAVQQSEEVREAVARVGDALGAGGPKIQLPDVAIARAAAYAITGAEGGHRHLARLKQRAGDFDPNTRDRFLAGALSPSAWWLQAQKFRAYWHRQVLPVFSDVDVLIAPATPVPATEIGQETMTLDSNRLLVRPNLGLFTQPISFLGLPVIAAPLHGLGALPVGVQLIAAPWNERVLFRAAARLEKMGICRSPAAPLS